MKKVKILSVLLALIVAILALTNPSLEKHKQATNKVFVSFIKTELQNNPMDYFVRLLTTKMVDNSVKRDNYFIFSLTRITDLENSKESKIIGYGLLGKVYISNDLKEKIKK